MKRRQVICRFQCLIAFTFIFSTSALAAGQGGAALPNIVLIVMDTVRWDALTMANPGLDTCPHLAKLAAGGVLFEKAYSTRDWTLPSHFSIFTGIHQRTDDLEVPANSLAFHLKSIGYETLGASANGLLTTRRSFIAPFDRFITPYWYYEKEIAEKKEYQEQVEKILDYYNAPSTLFSSATLLCSAENIRAVASKLLSNRSGKPLFLFLNFMEAHDPYFPDPAYYDIKQDGFLVDFYSDMRSRYIRPWADYVDDPAKLTEIQEKFEKYGFGLRWKIAADLTPEMIAVYRRRYEASIRQLDDQIGRLLADLEAQNLLDNTLVIITSDHGELFGEDGYMSHNFNNTADIEATRHVPLIVSSPLLGVSGLTVKDEVSIADIAPTIHELVGIRYGTKVIDAIPEITFGTSLNRYLKCEAPEPVHALDMAWQEQVLDREKRRQGVVEQLEALGYLE